MEKSYERASTEVKLARGACAATLLIGCPEINEALTLALTVEAGIETIVQAYWTEQNTIWETEIGNRCELGWLAKKSKFPSFPYQIIIPEHGAASMEQDIQLLKKQADLKFYIKDGNLESQATAKQLRPANWSVAWTK